MFKSLVTPVDMPTVSIAEKTSMVTSVRSSSGCEAHISSSHIIIREIFIVTTEAAFLRASDSRRLFITFMPLLFLRLAHTDSISIMAVVVLIPPAVEPEFPPINMNIIVSILLAGFIDATSTVLKPAVLGVTAINMDDDIL